MKCNACGSDAVFESKLMGSLSGTTGFALEPNEGTVVKRGIIPEAWVCQACRNVMFFVPEGLLDKVFWKDNP